MPPSSLIKATLTVVGETAKYRYRNSPGIVRLKSGGLDKYSLSYMNALSYSSDHSKAFLKILKKGRHLFVDQEMNMFKAAIFPVNC
jgi:hypothetical protein